MGFASIDPNRRSLRLIRIEEMQHLAPSSSSFSLPRVVRLGIMLLALAATAIPAAATSRIKDIADFEGVRENQLVGYGLVVGLDGTGDSLRNAPFTRQSLAAMLERLGVNATNGNLNTRNVAAVMVTANLPPFAAQGSRIDV